MTDWQLCCICLTGQPTHAVLPCGHMCLCSGCAGQLVAGDSPRCPICRSYCQTTGRIFGAPPSDPHGLVQAVFGLIWSLLQRVFSQQRQLQPQSSPAAGSAPSAPPPEPPAPALRPWVPVEATFGDLGLWAPDALETARRFLYDRGTISGLRFYAVWHIPGHPGQEGVHISVGLRAYSDIMEMANHDFKIIKWRNTETLAAALVLFCSRADPEFLPAAVHIWQ